MLNLLIFVSHTGTTFIFFLGGGGGCMAYFGGKNPLKRKNRNATDKHKIDNLRR